MKARIDANMFWQYVWSTTALTASVLGVGRSGRIGLPPWCSTKLVRTLEPPRLKQSRSC